MIDNGPSTSEPSTIHTRQMTPSKSKVDGFVSCVTVRSTSNPSLTHSAATESCIILTNCIKGGTHSTDGVMYSYLWATGASRPTLWNVQRRRLSDAEEPPPQDTCRSCERDYADDHGQENEHDSVILHKSPCTHRINSSRQSFLIEKLVAKELTGSAMNLQRILLKGGAGAYMSSRR